MEHKRQQPSLDICSPVTGIQRHPGRFCLAVMASTWKWGTWNNKYIYRNPFTQLIEGVAPQACLFGPFKANIFDINLKESQHVVPHNIIHLLFLFVSF